MPLPTRRRALRPPGAGFNSCRFMTPQHPPPTSRLSYLFDFYQMLHLVNHATNAGVVFFDDRLVETAQSQRPQRLLLVLSKSDGAPLQGYLDLSHRTKPPSPRVPRAFCPADAPPLPPSAAA